MKPVAVFLFVLGMAGSVGSPCSRCPPHYARDGVMAMAVGNEA